ncbi:MAG: hypothetical protein J2P25_20125 [Nocardiopsaceae bacterium]|nr:hypothetical protein [Nocardiopsaceae bacterium]
MIEQIDVGEYDGSGKLPVATILVTVRELEESKGLRFHDDRDDLDDFKWAPIRLSSGTDYALVHHAQAPERGIAVYGNPERADLGELAGDLGIPREALIPARPPSGPAK